MESFYIKRISIKNLWGKDISWDLKQDVNVLVGSNGFGKSTILNMVEAAFSPKRDFEWDSVRNKFSPITTIEILLGNDIVISIDENGERTFKSLSSNNSFELDEERLLSAFNLELIKTFDVPIEQQRRLESTVTFSLKGEINEHETYLSLLIKHYVKGEFRQFESEFSDLLEEVYDNDRNIQTDAREKLESRRQRRTDLVQKIDTLFEATEKKFDRKLFAFRKKGQSEIIDIERLSSGEKQILYILFNVFFQNHKPYILLLDEPEISLDTDWQKLLINYILEINPNCQVIAATHSPSIFYLDWQENFVVLDELLQPTSYQLQEDITINTNSAIVFDEIKINAIFSGISKNQPLEARMRLIAFNQRLNNFYELSFADAGEILRKCENDLDIAPDVITYTTLISKLNSLQDAEKLISLMISKNIQPNQYTMNNMIKKTSSITAAFRKLEDMATKFNLKPDIIAFTTILGKTHTSSEAKEVEKMRVYHKVESNYIYTERLKYKI